MDLKTNSFLLGNAYISPVSSICLIAVRDNICPAVENSVPTFYANLQTTSCLRARSIKTSRVNDKSCFTADNRVSTTYFFEKVSGREVVEAYASSRMTFAVAIEAHPKSSASVQLLVAGLQ